MPSPNTRATETGAQKEADALRRGHLFGIRRAVEGLDHLIQERHVYRLREVEDSFHDAATEPVAALLLYLIAWPATFDLLLACVSTKARVPRPVGAHSGTSVRVLFVVLFRVSRKK